METNLEPQPRHANATLTFQCHTSKLTAHLRQSDARLLKHLPSVYMRGMYYTSLPLEATGVTLL
jgi:hypothetical protein